MSDFRRTLPAPAPGRTVGEAVEDSVHRHSRKASTPVGERHKSIPPGRATPGLASSPRDLRRSRPGKKTPHPARLEPEARGGAHDAAAPSALTPRTLSSALAERS